MTITFVSNYINHHQIPLCECLYEALGEQFTFIQTEVMEEERVRMGWNEKNAYLPYVVRMYEDRERALSLLMDSDVVLAGWAPSAEDLILQRLLAKKPVIRISERLYREGRWKAVSPRGLLSKYRAFTRFRNGRYYLLCSGAYTASDFDIIRAFPGKKMRWGYFPPLKTYEEGEPERTKQLAASEKGGSVILTWAGRFMDVKHPELVLALARNLKERGIDFHLNMIGSGGKEEEYRAFVQQEGLTEKVTFHGFLSPEEVRRIMEQSRIFIFTSDHGEGWGAVLNEAMNSGCAVIAGSEAGGVPALIRHGENGLIYNGTDEKGLLDCALYLLEDPERAVSMGEAAGRTIREEWNAGTAAGRLLHFCERIVGGEDPLADLPKSGPLSPDPSLKPFLKVSGIPRDPKAAGFSSDTGAENTAAGEDGGKTL